MKVPSTGGKGDAPLPGGGPNSGPRRSPELIENSFSDKSAMAKRLELVLGPGDFEKHGFQAILGAQKSQKNLTLFKNSVFSAVSSLGTHPIFFSMSKTHPPMPWSIPRIIWKLSFERFFLGQKIHFRKMCMISWFSAVSGLGSITSVFSGSR